MAPNRQTVASERGEARSNQIESMLKKRVVRDAEMEEYPSPGRS